MAASEDEEWEDVVRWKVNCLVNAKKLGIKSVSVEGASENGTPEVPRVLGVEGDSGENLGLE